MAIKPKPLNKKPPPQIKESVLPNLASGPPRRQKTPQPMQNAPKTLKKYPEAFWMSKFI